MKILVTGGTVFVSKFIAKYFADRDNEVYVFNRNTVLQNKIMPELIPLPVGFQRAYEWYKHNKNQLKSKNYFDYIEHNLKYKAFP